MRAASHVRWPTSDDGEIVFDLAWLDDGTRRPVSTGGEAVIQAALASPKPEAILFAPGVETTTRTEYHRRRAIARFGQQFLHQPQHKLAAGDVRGVFYLEWASHIEHMQRTGHLESALSLVYEVIDAAERVDALDGFGVGAAGWYKRAAVLLRKMGDHAAEVRLIDDVTRRYPGRTGMETRRQTAVRLRDRTRMSDS